MVETKASDLFFTCNAPVKIKIEGKIFPVNKQVLSPETVRQAALGLMTAGADRALQRGARDRFRDLGVRPRPIPGQRLLSARLSRDGAALHHGGNAQARRSRHARRIERAGHAEARDDSHGGCGGRRQVHHPRRNDQLPQRDLIGSHPDHRGSDRIPAHQQEIHRQPARSRPGHQVLRARIAQRRALGAGRDPGRRDSRS